MSFMGIRPLSLPAPQHFLVNMFGEVGGGGFYVLIASADVINYITLKVIGLAGYAID